MLKDKTARSVCLLLMGLVASTAIASQPSPSTPELMARGDVPGLGLAEVSGDRIRVSVHGCARCPSDPVTESTMFEAASLTKPVVAYVVMRLVDQGRLELDDALIELDPSLPLPADDPRSRRVTVRMALAHMSGLQGPDDRELSFAADPGTAFEYYPPGYRLVQRAVERLEGMSLEDVARREVFAPLGMNSSTLVYREEYQDRLAMRHRMLGEPIDRRPDPAAPANAAASLLTTAGDYGRFLGTALRGEGLSASSWKAMLEPQIEVADTGGAVAWGIGWGLEPGRGTFFHYGDDGAAKSFTIGVPGQDRALVYFANGFYGMTIAGEMADRVVAGASPAVAWLGYLSWDEPKRLVRRDTIRAFVEAGPDEGLATFERFERNHPELDMENHARFVAWVLDERDLHLGRGRMIAWQLERNPGDTSLRLDQARSLQAGNDLAGALTALERARQDVDGDMDAIIGNRIRWIRDELAMDDPARAPSPVAIESLAGDFGPRQVRFESGSLWYQREGRPRFRLVWMCGTTYALEGETEFRVRFDLEKGSPATLVGLYEDGRSDASPRTG